MSKQKKIAIVDYQLGNLHSVNQACIYLGADVVVTSDKKDLERSDAIILPGVGAFGDAMNNLKNLDLAEPLKEYVKSGKPFMGICLGLQLLFSESEEFGKHEGLGIIEGKVKKFESEDQSGNVVKVPQIQWNTIEPPKGRSWQSTPFESCNKGDFMYFVHSFYVQPETPEVILSETEYGGNTYCSSVLKNNVFACQFHPEKSGEKGLNIYKWWFENVIK